MFLGHGNSSGNDVVNYHLFSDHVLTLDSSNIAKNIVASPSSARRGTKKGEIILCS